ncbi:MAG TPA: hypothetical protein VIR98_00505 [Candidatus Paceibacterota bacterium]|jgi:hypothetical protein
MTPEEKALLIEVRDLARENNEVLRSIRRSNRLSTFFKVLYWVLILGLSFGAYWLIQPYVDMLKGSLGAIQGNPSAETSDYSLSGALNNLKELNTLYKN